jgi:uncharacterized membrane protein YeaQ/YmgE (transglycosylase-associated protein family)
VIQERKIYRSELTQMKKEYESTSVNAPYQRSQVVTERTQRGSRLSAGTIAIVAILATAAVAIVLFLLSVSNRSGLLILSRQESSALSFVAWILIGLVVGFIGSKILNRTGRGRLRDVLLGIVGAMVGGFLSNLLGKSSGSGVDFYSLLVAAVGATVFMFVNHALFRRRRFLSMK